MWLKKSCKYWCCMCVDASLTLFPGDALLKPQLLKMMPYSLNRLTISLQPSLEKFESLLLQLINADCHNTVRRSLYNTHKLDSLRMWLIWCSEMTVFHGRCENMSNHLLIHMVLQCPSFQTADLLVGLKIDAPLRKINSRCRMRGNIVKWVCTHKASLPLWVQPSHAWSV